MSDREDRKLREVPVATYQYRYEAEFAAGFLKDAGIPYRLQIDDPALGISMSTPAKIWVAAIDERRARAVLDGEGALEPVEEAGVGGPEAGVLDGVRLDERKAEDGEAEWEESGSDGPGRRAGELSRHPAARRTPRRGRIEPAATIGKRGNRQSDLTLRQRLISMAGSVAVASLLGVEGVREAGLVATTGIALVGAALAVVAMSGRAPGFLTRLLAALSGDAP